jgi:hypothetical protein
VATQPPIKTTPEDVDAVAAYLRNKVGWTDIEDVKKRIPSKHADNRKIEAMRYIGLLDRDGSNIKLSDPGREYASGDPAAKSGVVRNQMRQIPLYDATLEWIHHHGHEVVTKTDVANYWHDHLSEESGNAAGQALTDAAVLFARLVGLAGLGKFVAAGRGRDTEIRVDRAALAEYVSGERIHADREKTPEPTQQQQEQQQKQEQQRNLKVGTDLQVNVEIHIAADAKPATIEEIFRNMRKYLLDKPDLSANGG